MSLFRPSVMIVYKDCDDLVNGPNVRVIVPMVIFNDSLQ